MDFFPPVVDDPWTWGAVAAVNAMSDVYAMGGEVLSRSPWQVSRATWRRRSSPTVFRGGRDKVGEAGGVIAGGHTVVDAEPKYGLCVTGRVDPDRILVKGGLRPGDRVFLSKPLGTGVITTAAKNERGSAGRLAGAVQACSAEPGRGPVARESGAKGRPTSPASGFSATRRDGQGLRRRARDRAARLPVLPGALALAERGNSAAG